MRQYITSYDLIKTLAFITMVVDHIGYYIFPESIEWRIIGRMSMPIWMFLIGYAHTRHLKNIFVGGAILFITNAFLGLSLIPFDILFTILFARLLFVGLDRYKIDNISVLSLIFVICTALSFHSYHYFEYGTSAFLFAITGYLTRHKPNLPSKHYFIALAYVTSVSVSLSLQIMLKNLTLYESGAVALALLTSCILLYQFKPSAYPSLTKNTPALLKHILFLMGRHTLTLYIIQMILFKLTITLPLWW